MVLRDFGKRTYMGMRWEPIKEFTIAQNRDNHYVSLIDSQDHLPTSFARPKQTTALKFSWQLDNKTANHHSSDLRQNQEEWTYTKVGRGAIVTYVSKEADRI